MEVELVRYPTLRDWRLVKRATLETVGLTPKTPPSREWMEQLLRARHSPIRILQFVFELRDIPYWVSTHLVRHVHATPFVKSQRNDRQNKYDRNKAPQDTPVNMMWCMNAEELMVVCSKRLCKQASPETRAVVQEIKNLVIKKCPEFADVLKPACEWQGGICYEINGCKKAESKHE